MSDNELTAANLANNTTALVDALEGPMGALRVTALSVSDQMQTSVRYGLGASLVASDLLCGLLPELKQLERLARQARQQIEELQR